MKSSANNEKRPAAANGNQHPLEQRASEPEFDDSEDVGFWEAQTADSETGHRISDSSAGNDLAQGRGREQLDDDLALESHAQTGGDRSVQKVQSEGKSTAGSKHPAGQHSPKRANMETHSDYGAAERRTGGNDSQGITAHKSGEEDSRQEKVVSIRNDAKAAGRRTGSKSKAS